MIGFNNNDITGIVRNNKQMIALYIGKKLVWEIPVGYIFTSDDFSVVTNEGYIIKCKDQ